MIEIPPASFHITPYGEVDAVALERLREDFDTSQLLRLVDGFYPISTDGLKRAENFKSCRATLRCVFRSIVTGRFG
jgi:hypothetical protein